MQFEPSLLSLYQISSNLIPTCYPCFPCCGHHPTFASHPNPCPISLLKLIRNVSIRWDQSPSAFSGVHLSQSCTKILLIFRAASPFYNGQMIHMSRFMKHSLICGQKVHLCSVQIVSQLRPKKRICCSFGVRVKSVGRTKRAILVLAKRGAAAISIWHSRPLTLQAHLCGPALKDANNSMLRQDHDLKEWSSLGIKGCPAFLDMGTAHWEAQKPPNVCQRVPWRIRSQDKQTVCGFLAQAMIKWVLWWRCWCFGFQRPLCLCSSAERVCSAERELDRPWCEYELHEWGSLPGCRVQLAQAV